MRYIILATIVTLLSGCMTQMKVKEPSFEKAVSVNSPFEKTWTSVIKYFSERGIPVKTLDKSSGLIATEPMSFTTGVDLFQCDSVSFAGKSLPMPGSAYFNVFVTKIDDKSTKVQMNTFGKAVHTTTGTLYVPPTRTEYTCYSTGVMEKQLFEIISGNVQTPLAATK